MGGAAVQTPTGADEVGTIAGGTMSSDVDGNDVVVYVTYTADGTLYYKLRIERSRLRNRLRDLGDYSRWRR